MLGGIRRSAERHLLPSADTTPRNVADVEKNRDFYIDLLGMRLIYYKPGDVFGVDKQGGPICFLRFGQDSLYFRRASVRTTSRTWRTSCR